MLAGKTDGFGVAGIRMPHHTHSGIYGEHALQAHSRFGGAISHNHLTGMLTKADAHTTAMVERHPGGATHGVNKRI